jgi:hypothetical protein
MVSMIIKGTLWLTVIGCMYYMSDQIVQLENRVEALEAHNIIINRNIEILHEAIHFLIKLIKQKLNLFA